MDLTKIANSANTTEIVDKAKENLPMLQQYMPMIKQYWWVIAIVVGVLAVGGAVWYFFFREQ